VFFVGSHAGSQVTHHWQYPRVGTPAIQLDIDPLEIGRNYPIEIGLHGDAKATLRRLLDAAETPRGRTAWHERVRAVVGEWRAETQPLRTSETLPMRPERLCEELTAWLPSSAVVVADTGHAGIWTGTMLDLNRPGQRYLRAAGSLGWGMPAALGAKCALPDRPVLCFTGDGGFYYHLAELETAARYGINAVILVNNNRSLNQDLWSCRAAFGDPYSEGARDTWMFRELDLARVAESLGCLGLRVERPSELGSALDQAFSANRPTVIDVITETEALAERAHA
jgi:acetolactate synthase-1/2/3 large subunit